MASTTRSQSASASTLSAYERFASVAATAASASKAGSFFALRALSFPTLVSMALRPLASTSALRSTPMTAVPAAAEI